MFIMIGLSAGAIVYAEMVVLYEAIYTAVKFALCLTFRDTDLLHFFRSILISGDSYVYVHIFLFRFGQIDIYESRG